MTIRELKDCLTKYTDEGKGDAPVLVARKEWNPVTESEDIVEVLFVERKDSTCTVILQMD